MEYQIARLLYQHKKILAVRQGVSALHGANPEFELYTFFEVCFHLKDWIQADPQLDKSKYLDVEEFIEGSTALKICGDICNRLKHRVVTRRKRTNPMPTTFALRTSVNSSVGGVFCRLENATVDTVRGTENCFDLCWDCLQEWNRYFEACGIRTDLFAYTTVDRPDKDW